MNELKIKGIYKHFKGDYYIVEDIAIHSETKEEYEIEYQNVDYYGEYKYSDQFFYQKVFENYTCTGGGSMDYGQLPEEYKEILKKCMKTWDSRVTKERREIIQQGILLYGVTYSMDLARGDTNIDNPKYLDCSSFVGQCYWRSGVATEGRAAASWSTPTNSSGIFNKIDSSESIPGDIGQQCWPGNAGGADHTGIYIGTVDGQRYYLHCTSWSPETNAKHSPGKGIVIGVSAKLDNNAARYHGFS